MSLTVKEVTENLTKDVFEAVPNTKGKSGAWKVFHLVKNKLTGQSVGYVQCTKCGLVLVNKEVGGGTSTMSRHITVKHNDEEVRKIAPASAKKSFLDACVFYIGRDRASTYSLEGEGLRRLLQTAVDIASTHGAVAVTDLMPHRTTVTQHVCLEAERVRNKLAPTLRTAIREGCGGAMDLWTNQFTNEHWMAFTLSFIDDTFNLKVYNLLTVHFSGDETAENIEKNLVNELWQKYEISEADLKNTTMVTDGGENVVKAMKNFNRWLYCIDHALNVCVRGALELKYHVILGKCFELPSVAALLKCCESILNTVKEDKTKDTVKLRRVLKKPKQHNSRMGMLLSIRAHFNEVRDYLYSCGKNDVLAAMNLTDIDELIDFLMPFDFDGKREKSAEVSIASLGDLLDHCTQQEGDRHITAALKMTVHHELQLMTLVEQVEKCKKLVVFFKTSGLMKDLPKSLKQEIEVRWNSILNLLISIEESWDQVAVVLEAAKRTDKMAGIQRNLLRSLIKFYSPFKEESAKLEGEKYPTLPLAQLSFHRLKHHCEQPLTGENGEPELICFTLMRTRASELLSCKLKLTVTHSIGTVLFPPYRKLQRLPDLEREAVYKEIRRLIADDEPDRPDINVTSSPKRLRLTDYDGWDDDENLNEKEEDDLTRYLRNAVGTVRLEQLLQWWKTDGAAYPKLQSLAKRYLGIQATSATVERTFSGAGFILDARSTKMSAKTADSILFLNSFYRQG